MTIQATRIVITCRFWHTFRSTSRENGSTILWGALCPNSFTRATAGNCWNERPWDYFCCGTKFSGRSQGSRCTPCSPPSCRGFPVPTKDLVWLPSLLWLLTIRWVHTKGGYRVRGKMWTIQSTKWFCHLTSLLSIWLFLSDLVQVAHPCYPSCLSVPDQTIVRILGTVQAEIFRAPSGWFQACIFLKWAGWFSVWHINLVMIFRNVSF